MTLHLLGLPLEKAILRLRAAGVEPHIEISRAPRRPQQAGALRVIRVREGGRRLTACAFALRVGEEKAP